MSSFTETMNMDTEVMNMKPGLMLTDYNDKSIVIRGDTRTYKDELKALGGKWAARLDGGGGWIYPMTQKEKIEKWMRGEVEVSVPEQQTTLPTQQYTHRPSPSVFGGSSQFLAVAKKAVMALVAQVRDVEKQAEFQAKVVDNDVVLSMLVDEVEKYLDGVEKYKDALVKFKQGQYSIIKQCFSSYTEEQVDEYLSRMWNALPEAEKDRWM